MKIIIIIFILISFLFQNCYSYKTIYLKKDTLRVGNRYKIISDTKCFVYKLESANDSVLNLTYRGAPKQIRVSEINEIKAGKFSALKTIGLVPIVYAGISLIALSVALSNPVFK